MKKKTSFSEWGLLYLEKRKGIVIQRKEVTMPLFILLENYRFLGGLGPSN